MQECLNSIFAYLDLPFRWQIEKRQAMERAICHWYNSFLAKAFDGWLLITEYCIVKKEMASKAKPLLVGSGAETEL